MPCTRASLMEDIVWHQSIVDQLRQRLAAAHDAYIRDMAAVTASTALPVANPGQVPNPGQMVAAATAVQAAMAASMAIAQVSLQTYSAAQEMLQAAEATQKELVQALALLPVHVGGGGAAAAALRQELFYIRAFLIVTVRNHVFDKKKLNLLTVFFFFLGLDVSFAGSIKAGSSSAAALCHPLNALPRRNFSCDISG